MASSTASRRSRGIGAGSVVCLLGLLAGLAALAAGRLSARWIELDIFNHFVPQLAVLIIACLVGLVMPRAKAAVALGLVIGGVIGIGLWPHFASGTDAGPSPALAGERLVRILSFNTRFENSNWRAVAEEVARHDPDVIVLLEVGRDKLPLLDALEAAYPHRHDCLREDYCQNVILSKQAFASTETFSDWQGPPMVRVTFGPELGGLSVVGAHTTRLPFLARQLNQMTALGEELAASDGAKIVVGDFNSTPFSRMLGTLLERGGLELASGMPTWPATVGLPQIAIDHVMVSPGLRVPGPARIGSPAGSDHYPVIADIAVPLSD